MINQFKDEYRFLSNFWYVKVILDGVTYKSVEHAFQAAKTVYEEEREIIRNANTPSDAKKLGKNVRIRPDWENAKRVIMLDLLRQKFSIPTLKAKLLATSNATLIEGNFWHDNYWGICYCHICSTERAKEEPELGKNWLGRLLMLVRTELEISA